MIRHVVLFTFRGDLPSGTQEEAVKRFRALRSQISDVASFEHGTNVSPEGYDQGFTHCFLLDFADKAARDRYLAHKAQIDFSTLRQPTNLGLLTIAIMASLLAWLTTLFVIKNISADYSAIAEISYPLFTVLFGYLIFGRKLDWSMALGACLIIAGSFILVSGKLKTGG